MQASVGTMRIGCCGFAMGQAKYFEQFNCVEINSTFYNLPRLETARRWRHDAPADFEFGLKAWQVITHRPTSPTYKRTRLSSGDLEHCGHFGFNPTIRWAWAETFAIAAVLKAKTVLFQCPASFRSSNEHIDRLRTFFERAKRGKLIFAWEPRGNWDPEVVRSLCRELDLVHVVDPFKMKSVATVPIRYFRLHGVSGTRHKFTDVELKQLHEWAKGRPPTYCFFNNVAMAQDAARFRKMVG